MHGFRAVRGSLALVVVLAAAIATGGSTAPPVGAAVQPQYSVADLGTLGGRLCAGYTGANSFGTAVNASGEAAGGSCKFVGFFQPVIGAASWSGGSTTDLGVAGAAYGINDAGVVVGGSGSPDFEASGAAFVFQGGSLTSLAGVLGGFSRAYDINNRGQVVGLRGTPPAIDRWRSFLYDMATGDVVDLGALGGTFRSTATAVNDEGQVAGWASLSNENTFHAFLWSNGVMTDLGTLGGHSFGRGLNSSGQVVGDSWLATGGSHAFLYSGGSMEDLGTLGGGFSIAWAINDRGVVVGSAGTPTAGQHAFVWTNGTMRDLNDLVPADSGWVLEEARAINIGGQIVGTGRLGGEQRAFLLTPSGDLTPPVLSVPDDITVDADSHAGASVTFTATATDEDPANPAVSCTPPSGGLFPIGTTTVTCEATDTAGNRAEASFTVHVKGAGEQLGELLAAVTGVGPGTSLADKAAEAQAAFAEGNVAGACRQLNAFVNQVEALPDNVLPAALGGQLLEAADRIRDVLAC